MTYFCFPQGFDIRIAIEFSRGLNSFMARVRGIDVPVIKKVISWVTRLSIEGEQWINNIVDYTTLKDEFIRGTIEQLQGTSKGVLSSLVKPCNHVTLSIKKYLICEGRQQLLYGYHFQLLVHLRHRRYVNVPYFLLKLLELMCNKVQQSQKPITSITHHRLLKLLVCDDQL